MANPDFAAAFEHVAQIIDGFHGKGATARVEQGLGVWEDAMATGATDAQGERGGRRLAPRDRAGGGRAPAVEALRWRWGSWPSAPRRGAHGVLELVRLITSNPAHAEAVTTGSAHRTCTPSG